MLNTHIEADTVAELQARVQELEHAVRVRRMSRAQIKRQRKAAARQHGAHAWQQALDHELVAANLGRAGPATLEEARKAVRELILWNIQAATSRVPLARSSTEQLEIEPKPQPQHSDCGCSVCNPSFEADDQTLSVTVRYDLSTVTVEGAIRNKLIEMGWTPPAAAVAKASPPRIKLQDAGELRKVFTFPGGPEIWALYRDGAQVRYLNKFENDFVDSTLAATPAAAAVLGDNLVTYESAVQAIEHVAIHNSASREREALDMLVAAPKVVTADQVDAERYRWLRSCNLSKHPAIGAGFEFGDTHLDSAIDAAIRANSRIE